MEVSPLPLKNKIVTLTKSNIELISNVIQHDQMVKYKMDQENSIHTFEVCFLSGK